MIFKVVLILVLVTLVFGGKILTEIQLARVIKARELIGELVMSHFHPLTEEEKIDIRQDFITKMQTLQDKVDKSFIAKHFVDYCETIQEYQQEVKTRKQKLEDSEDLISFSTIGLQHVIASPSFEREPLLMLATLIDDMFDSDSCSAIFELHYEDHNLVMEIDCMNGVIEEEQCQEFAKRASQEIFENTPVDLNFYK
ncbi:MAG: hypothetical protein K940chlam9_01184 [Chlamydiae bacterium]|nr:hypothetical protein [Chlamydiota bacterium]